MSPLVRLVCFYEFHSDLQSELERLQSYHQQHAEDAAKMSGKAPKTVLLNEEDWNEMVTTTKTTITMTAPITIKTRARPPRASHQQA